MTVTKQGLEAGLLAPALTRTPRAGEGQGPGPCPSPRLPLLFQTWRASTFRTVFWTSPPRASPPMAGPHPRSPLSRLLPHSPPALNSSIGSGCQGARGPRVGPACRAPSPQWTAAPSQRTRCSITEAGPRGPDPAHTVTLPGGQPRCIWTSGWAGPPSAPQGWHGVGEVGLGASTPCGPLCASMDLPRAVGAIILSLPLHWLRWAASPAGFLPSASSRTQQTPEQAAQRSQQPGLRADDHGTPPWRGSGPPPLALGFSPPSEVG